jgi:hypothetical protein
VGLVVLAVIGAVAVGVLSKRSGQAEAAAAPVSQFVRIQDVQPNVVTPKVQQTGSSGVFSVNCGTNGNRKLSPDNPVAQPGIKNGAQHVHDFVGNLSISAASTDASLQASGTTCRNGDKSSYFWPVVRINRKANVSSAGTNADTLKAAGPATITCPTVNDKLPAVPAAAQAEVTRNLALLDQQIGEAQKRLVSSVGQGGPDFVNNAILGPLSDKRTATLDRIAIAIARTGAPRPTNLASLADCDLSFDHAGHHGGGASTAPGASPTSAGGASGGSSDPVAVTPTVNCPTVRDKVGAVPDAAVAEVNRNLDLLDKQIAEANQRIVDTQGQGGKNFIQNAILGPLKDKRTSTLDRITIAIGRAGGTRPALAALATCTLNNGNGQTGGGNNGGGNNGGGATAAPSPSPAASDLPGVSGPNLEIGDNIGNILRPASVRIEYRGNAASKVVPMPVFLKALTGDAKPAVRGLANVRATWTCSGFTNRITTKYVICPAGSQVMRISDFPSCWDGVNTDSANHRTHIVFPDAATGVCPAGTKAVPEVRISISYNIPQAIQQAGQYQLDAFDEENHDPASDHNDFENVNSVQTMARIANCINAGRRCN